MTTRHVRSALVASLLTFGMVALVPATGRAQNSTTLPDEGQMITLTGCFTQGVIGNSSKERFVLAKAFVGTVASVAEPTCTASGTDQMIKLQDLHQVKMGAGQYGRWVQVYGRLEGNHKDSDDHYRELHVKSFSLVPVVVPAPKVAEVIIQQAPTPEPPAPAPQIAEAAPAPEPQPVATSGERKSLPKTATSVPLFGLIGLLSIGSGFALQLFNRRRFEQV
jgi:LPXTG-motif cell wall-anchored protein